MYFTRILELPIGVAACFILVCRSFTGADRRGNLLRISLVAAAAFVFVNSYTSGMQAVRRTRNFYGALLVTETGSATGRRHARALQRQGAARRAISRAGPQPHRHGILRARNGHWPCDALAAGRRSRGASRWWV